MMDAGIHPSERMYQDIFYFAQKSGGADYAAIIKDRIGMQYNICLLPYSVPISFCRIL